MQRVEIVRADILSHVLQDTLDILRLSACNRDIIEVLWTVSRLKQPPESSDYSMIPVNAAGREAADRFDPGADRAVDLECKAYGASGKPASDVPPRKGEISNREWQR